MTASKTPQHNGVVEISFKIELNCIRSMLYQENFTEEMESKLWGMVVLYLQHTRNMTSKMANSDKLSPNTKFDNEDNIEIERMQPFGRIRFVTIRSNMKRKYPKEVTKQLWLEYQNITTEIVTTCTILRREE